MISASASPTGIPLVVTDGGQLEAGNGNLHGDGDGHQDSLDTEEELFPARIVVVFEHVVYEALHAVHAAVLLELEHCTEQDVDIEQGGRKTREERPVDIQLL